MWYPEWKFSDKTGAFTSFPPSCELFLLFWATWSYCQSCLPKPGPVRRGSFPLHGHIAVTGSVAEAQDLIENHGFPQKASNRSICPSCFNLYQQDEKWNHRMVWVGRDLEDHLFPTPLPWAGTSSTSPGCSELHPTWPWILPGRGQPQLLWATCARASPPSRWRISS